MNNRLLAIPDGLMFMVPTKILPTIASPLFTWSTKFKMALEFFAKPSAGTRDGDRQGHDPTRHYGQEVMERLADPLLGQSMRGGDADSLSVEAVLPRFAEIERNYGSLGRGMLAAQRKMAEIAKRTEASERPRSLFSSLTGGMQQMADTVARILPPDSVRLDSQVQSVGRDAKGWLIVVAGQADRFDGLIIAAPAHVAGTLLGPVDESLSSDLFAISYSSSVTVGLTYNRADLAHLPPGFGFLVPQSEKRRIRALTFVHNKFPHRAPVDKGILRVFLGGLADEGVLQLGDEEILETVRRELRELVKLDAAPRTQRVYRWNKAMAQYGRGHLDRVNRIERAVASIPGLALAGNAYRGIGVPDCISSGLNAANSLLDSSTVDQTTEFHVQ